MHTCIIVIFLTIGGFTHLQSSRNEFCIGENVTISCETSWLSIRWEVILSDRTSLSYLFDSDDSVGATYSRSLRGIQLNLELVSNSMEILNSMLRIQTTSALNNAAIECQGTVTKVQRFKLTGIIIILLFQKSKLNGFLIVMTIIKLHWHDKKILLCAWYSHMHQSCSILITSSSIYQGRIYNII